jgi:predicted DNA-binding transcriptional regulator AlpA
MSSNISVYRICGFFGSEFIAKKNTIKYCSLKCESKDYKRRLKNQKIESSNIQTIKIKNQPLINLKDKEFLNVKQLALLLGFSVKTVYRLINTKKKMLITFQKEKPQLDVVTSMFYLKSYKFWIRSSFKAYRTKKTG